MVLVLGAVGAAIFVWWRWEYRERRFDKLIVASAAKYGVDPCLVKAVMRRESKFDPFVYGSHGEIGLMQVTVGAGEAWARAVGRRGFGGSALWDAGVNVEAGTWYLGRALGRWRGREFTQPELGVALAVAEYNAGYGNVLRWLKASEGGKELGESSGGTVVGGAALGSAAGNGLNEARTMGSGGAGLETARTGGMSGLGSTASGGIINGEAGGKELGGNREVTVEEFVGGITYPGVRDYVREVMENWRMYRERGGL